MTTGIILVVVGVACVAVALVLALTGPAEKTRPRAHARLRFPVADIGSFRYFDLRAFPREALTGYAHVDAAKRSIAGADVPAAAYVWVMPLLFAVMLEEAEGFAKHLLLTRLRDPVRRPTPVFVYVEGWRPEPRHDALARDAGVELLVELPRIIGPDEDRDTREMLDEAARARSEGP